jgi:hypothetical protein|tara:strand:- start:795 stop:1202 length:408 start_codon:yes stop_codon:yes gene_type:complete
MMFRVLVAGIILLLAGCTAQKTAEEYGSNAADVIFACAGENWVSQQFNEKFCLMRSVKNPNEYVLAEDTAEKYGDSVLAGLTFGVSLLFDGDIQEKWLAAAREFVAEKYGADARVINFRSNQGAAVKGYAFEVLE